MAVGVVGVPDERLEVLGKLFGSAKIVPATVSFVDIAGIVRGASEGAGLGNKFLANIREADAICQVIRAFTDPDVVHVDGKVSPADDIETINTELILADLQTIDKALPRLEKEARIAKDKQPVLAAVKQAREVLDSGRTVFAVGPDRLRHAGPADLPDRRAQGVPGLDDPAGRHRAAGRRCHSHRLAKARGKVRIEGKEYVMADGDVVEFRFNV